MMNENQAGGATGQGRNAGGIDRRQFMAGTAAAGMTVMAPQMLRAAAADEKIKIGLVGCGGRGSWIAGLFEKHGGFAIHAVADYFEDKVNAAGDKYNVPAERRFTTLSGYKKLLESDVGAVAIISPPYFHPQQAEDAVAAGKHVYLAKPVAVDVPGCKQVLAAGREARATKLAFLVDFQSRSQPYFIEALRRVHDGAIGDITFGEGRYHARRLRTKAEPGTPESRLRNWVFDIALSGDILTEQNIHTLDIMNWVMQKPPVSAFGTCGRKKRTDVGDCNDHFALHYRYVNDVGFTFSSKQYDDGAPDAGITLDACGNKGRLVTKYGGNVIIFGENRYAGGQTSQIYQEGVVNNIGTFHDQIINGSFENQTLEPSVQSNLVTILGRTAAYEKRVVTWDEIMKSDERMDGQLDDFKA